MWTAYFLFVCLLHGLDAEVLTSNNFKIVTSGGKLKANQRELFYRVVAQSDGKIICKGDWSKPILFTADQPEPAVSRHFERRKDPFLNWTFKKNPYKPGTFCWCDARNGCYISYTDAEFLKKIQWVIDEPRDPNQYVAFFINKPWKDEVEWDHVDMMSPGVINRVSSEGAKARIAPGNNYLNLVPAAGDRYGGAAAAAGEMEDDYLLYDEALQDLELAQKEFELAHELIASDKELKQEQKRQRRVKVKRQPARSRLYRMYHDEEYYY